MSNWRLVQGHTVEQLRLLEAGSVQCCASSIPYYALRSYGTEPQVWGGTPGCPHSWLEPEAPKSLRWGNPATLSAKQRSNGGSVSMISALERTSGQTCELCGAWCGELGQEPTVAMFVEHVVEVYREVWRVLHPSGVAFLNVGDTYSSVGKWGGSGDGGKNNAATRGGRPRDRRDDGTKHKDLCLVPQRLAVALQDAGWYIRSEIIWAKGISCCPVYAGSVMPESVVDRVSRAHEQVWMLAKSEQYFFDMQAVKEDCRTAENAWDTGENGLGGGESHAGTGGSTRKYGGTKRNLRSVWVLRPASFAVELCLGCDRIYDGSQYRRLVGGSGPRCDRPVEGDTECGGTLFEIDGATATCIACEKRYTKAGLKRLPRVKLCASCGSERWLSHFATWSPHLVRLMIRSGSSEAGCCPTCRAPWERVTEKGERDAEQQKACGGGATGEYDGHGRKDFAGTGAQDASSAKANILAGMKVTRTTGWQPTCKCPAHTPIPCLVLDQFSGSGTTVAEAIRLGRDGIGLELNPHYQALARWRIGQAEVGGLFVPPEPLAAALPHPALDL